MIERRKLGVLHFDDQCDKSLVNYDFFIVCAAFCSFVKLVLAGLEIKLKSTAQCVRAFVCVFVFNEGKPSYLDVSFSVFHLNLSFFFLFYSYIGFMWPCCSCRRIYASCNLFIVYIHNINSCVKRNYFFFHSQYFLELNRK